MTEKDKLVGDKGKKEKLEHNLQEAYSPSTWTKEKRASHLRPEPVETVAKDPES